MTHSCPAITINISDNYIEKTGNINTKIIHTARQIQTETETKESIIKYCIFNYDEEMVCVDDTIRGKYRSVIASYPEKEILSASIPKNVSLEYFKYHYTDITAHSIYVNELIEGTMIHLFYDARISSWEIATKRSIGGDYYYKHKLDADNVTFLNMVMDAFCEDRSKSINDISFLSTFPKQHSYQFVLQHPQNHIVFPIETPKMYLVGIYNITSFNEVKNISPMEYEKWSIFGELINKSIYFPKSYDIQNNITSENEIHYDSIQDEYVSIQTPILSRMGIMITNLSTAEHCIIMNPTYEEYKRVRGNYPDNQYLYLNLRKMGIVTEYLRFFPQYRKLFFKFRDEYETLIHNLHQSYLSYYILKKEVTLSKKYAYHVRALHHTIFLPSLMASNKQIITKKRVSEYVKTLVPGQILHILNFDKREVNMLLHTI